MLWRTPVTYLTGSVPIVVAAAFAVCVIALLSTLVASAGMRLFVVAIFALLVMSFDSRHFPIEALRPALERVPPVLAPVAGALKYATDTPPDQIAITSLTILSGYTLLLAFAALSLAAGRELNFD
jgi:hypothetical protein